MKKTLWLGFVLCALSVDGDTILSNPGQKVVLPCGQNNFKRHLKWSHQNTMVFRFDEERGLDEKGPGEISKRSTVKRMALEIQGVKESDAGVFTCDADGNLMKHLLLLITVSASPSNNLKLGSKATLQCQVKGLLDPVVQWKKPDGSLHPQVAQLNPVARSDEGVWNCIFSHDGEEYSKKLDIKVSEPAPTPAPPSVPYKEEPTCNDCVTSSTPPLVLGLSWWMWAIIGVGCLIVIVLMAFAICLYKKIQRKKRKLRKMENNRHRLIPKQYCQCNRPTAVPKLQQRRQRQKPSALPLQPLLVQ